MAFVTIHKLEQVKKELKEGNNNKPQAPSRPTLRERVWEGLRSFGLKAKEGIIEGSKMAMKPIKEELQFQRELRGIEKQEERKARIGIAKAQVRQKYKEQYRQSVQPQGMGINPLGGGSFEPWGGSHEFFNQRPRKKRSNNPLDI